MTDFVEMTIREAGLSLSITPNGPDRFATIYTSKYGQWTRNVMTQPGAPPPTLDALIYFHAMNAQQVENTDDVLDWAAEYGHRLTEPKALQHYRDLVAERDQLRKLLGERIYHDLLAGLAISQAIGTASRN